MYLWFIRDELMMQKSAGKCSLSQTLNLNENEGWDFVICERKRATAMATTNRGQRSATSVCSLFRTCSPSQSRITLLCECVPVSICACICLSSTYLWLHYLPAVVFTKALTQTHTHSRTPTAAALLVCVNWWHINFQLKSALSKHLRFQYWTSTGPVLLCNFIALTFYEQAQHS